MKMKLSNLQVGNAFKTQFGIGLKVREAEDCDAILCLEYGVLPFKRLVRPIAKAESFWIKSDENFCQLRSIDWGTIVKVPHKEIFYLVTCGVTMSGQVVSKLGDTIKLSYTTDVEDLGYSGKHIGLKSFEKGL